MARPRTLIDLTCACCGVKFQRDRCNHDKALRLNCRDSYCSAECSQEHHAVKNCKKCLQCGTALRFAGRCRNATFCSSVCRKAANAKPQIPCPHCGALFTPLSARTRYCSRNCANLAHSIRMIGQGNSHYTDGLSYAKWFDEMRPLILQRDKCCVVCGKTNFLHMHHVDHNPANNRRENLIMLCSTHHIVHHKSATTPWPWFADYAAARSRSMSPQWKARTTALTKRFAPMSAQPDSGHQRSLVVVK